MLMSQSLKLISFTWLLVNFKGSIHYLRIMICLNQSHVICYEANDFLN